MINLCGCDFSLNKPACCVLSNNKYTFYVWPHKQDKKLSLLSNSGINIIERFDTRQSNLKSTEKVREELINADSLSSLIIKTLIPYINKNTHIAFEGASFSSGGNIALQLATYRYLLMYKLMQLVPINNLWVFAPMSLKSTAGCAQKGSTKIDMINSFMKSGPDCLFKTNLKAGLLNKKNSLNYIECVDDICDSYFALKTLQEKM